jgi:hypothetical protein
MSIKRHKDSHLDHALTEAQVEFVLGLSAKEGDLTIQTVELPEELGTVPCGLFGPLMGDEPVSDDECEMVKRGNRPNASRVCDREPRQVRTVTVISGPHDGEACVLFTAFGGPLAPKEPGDVSIKSEAERKESEEFWAEHALAR